MLCKRTREKASRLHDANITEILKLKALLKDNGVDEKTKAKAREKLEKLKEHYGSLIDDGKAS